jgi:hypothetical protein
MNEWEMEEASRSRRSTKQTREGAVEISFLSLLSLFLINNLVFFSLSIGHEHVPRHFFFFFVSKSQTLCMGGTAWLAAACGMTCTVSQQGIQASRRPAPPSIHIPYPGWPALVCFSTRKATVRRRQHLMPFFKKKISNIVLYMT